MENLHNRRRLPHIRVNGDVLRIYAGITLLCSSVGLSVVQYGLMRLDTLSTGELQSLIDSDPHTMLLSSWASVLRLLGGLAIPVLAFLLTNRFLKSERYGRELFWLLALAVISEVPFDMAMSGTPFDLSRQSLMCSLVISFIMLYGLRMFAASRAVQLLIVLAAALWGSLFRADFALGVITLTAVFYILRDSPGKRLVWSSIIGLVLYVTAPLSHLVIRSYNGEDGSAWSRDIFGCLYPAHLLILAAIVAWLR